jgi:hypothetical protein
MFDKSIHKVNEKNSLLVVKNCHKNVRKTEK